MVAFNPLRHIVAAMAGGTLLAFASIAGAQDVAPTHLAAARAAVASIHATDSMDSILPQANVLLKQELIQKNPDREPDILTFTDEETLKLAERRGDLE
ncbi:MAG: hypothetical protein WBF87_02990, partial [Mesorhizobium sp.]